MKKLIILAVVLAIIAFGYYRVRQFVNLPVKALAHDYEGNLPLDQLQLPPGFKIDIYADQVINARSMDLSPEGTLYVGTRSEGNVYAIKDLDGDYRADTIYTLLTDGNMPNGVAYRNGDLYVAEVNRILKFENIEAKLDNPGEPMIVYDGYPTETHHGWKFIAFGPDSLLYVPVGAPCNICESEDPIYASISTLNVETNEVRIVQNGVRNTVGFTWHPDNNELWFTDNGRDMLGEDVPACELNHATTIGQHFGYPYCHQGDILDPKFGLNKNCDDYIKPAQKLGPHVAPLGLEFISGSQFPLELQHQILIAEHGSWNRKEKIGYRITKVNIDSLGHATSYEDFITGWKDAAGEVWGRPVDLEYMPDGSLLISDDFADVIYRLSYILK